MRKKKKNRIERSPQAHKWLAWFVVGITHQMLSTLHTKRNGKWSQTTCWLAGQPSSNEFITIGAERAQTKKDLHLSRGQVARDEELLLWQRLRCIYGTQSVRLYDGSRNMRADTHSLYWVVEVCRGSRILSDFVDSNCFESWVEAGLVRLCAIELTWTRGFACLCVAWSQTMSKYINVVTK